MKCQYCGHENKDEGVFCENCGGEIKPATQGTYDSIDTQADDTQQNNYQQPVQQNNYQQPQQPNNNKAIWSLVLGIIGLIFGGCCFPVSIVGLCLGVSAKKDQNNGMATAGIVLSIISLVLSVLAIVLYSLGIVGAITSEILSY